MSILSIAVFAYIFFLRKRNWKVSLTIKNIAEYIMFIGLGMILFVGLAQLLGRDGTDVDINSLSDILEQTFIGISIYAGAELKLLDIFVVNEYHNLPYTGFAAHTFAQFYQWLGGKLDVPEWQDLYYDDLGFNYVNAEFLGNVYTMFKVYFADFGFWGVVIFSSLMGLFFSVVYYHVKYRSHTNCKQKKVDYYLLIYGMTYFSIPLAFFSNWFYQMLNVGLLWSILWIIIFPYLFVTQTSHIENSHT